MFSIFGAGESKIEIQSGNLRPKQTIIQNCLYCLKIVNSIVDSSNSLSYMYIKVSSVYIIMLILNHLPPPIVKYSWAGYLCVQALRYGPFQKQIARYLQRLFIVWCLTHLRDTMRRRQMLLEKSPPSHSRLIDCFSTCAR